MMYRNRIDQLYSKLSCISF